MMEELPDTVECHNVCGSSTSGGSSDSSLGCADPGELLHAALRITGERAPLQTAVAEVEARPQQYALQVREMQRVVDSLRESVDRLGARYSRESRELADLRRERDELRVDVEVAWHVSLDLRARVDSLEGELQDALLRQDDEPARWCQANDALLRAAFEVAATQGVASAVEFHRKIQEKKRSTNWKVGSSYIFSRYSV
jgi:chromosome segregation ATPase